LKKYFVDFLHNLPFYGLAVLCVDDPVVQEIFSKISRHKITYGFSKRADYRILDWVQKKHITEFKIKRPGKKKALRLELNMPGKHNALNVAAAVAIASDEGINDRDIVRGVKNFTGVGRRFDIQGEFDLGDGSVMLIDDYGHHPTEVAATIKALRMGWPKNRLVMIYQPHRYSRTKELYEDFVDVLAKVDVLILLEVYSAGEKRIAGADSRSLCRSIRLRGKLDPIYVRKVTDVHGTLKGLVRDGDIVLTQGAGSIGGLAKEIAQKRLN